jgi:hypothetical protein
MNRKISPEKWHTFKESYINWWNNLSIEEKIKAKNNFLAIREWNKTQKNPYPNMWDITDIRVNKLSDKQIYRIWVFKDRNVLPSF